VVEGGQFHADEWDRDDFGLEAVRPDDLRAESAAESAAIITGVLAGEPSPARRIVLANTAAALWTAGAVRSLRDGVIAGENAIDSGEARAVLSRLRSAE
jgi:anthranilate phosphoribosyltransferase